MELFLLMAVSFVISAVCAWWCATRAMAKGYSPAIWGVLGFLFPIIAVIVIAVIRPGENAP